MDSLPLRRPVIRRADLTGADAAAVSDLLASYLRHTEREKAHHLGGSGAPEALPERYRQEVEDPATALEGAETYVADVSLAGTGSEPVGVVVVHGDARAREIKRLWVDPRARGHRVGSALLDTALGTGDLPVRLSVWDWRHEAIALYRARGFEVVASWDERPRLLCMQRPPGSPATSWSFRASARADAGWMAELRAEVMRADLERLGRFDENRVRRRFLDAFVPQHTRVIRVGSHDVGLIAVRPESDAVWIEHFYLAPAYQGRGIGTAVLAQILADGDTATPFRLNVLRGSAARALYERLGFVLSREDGVDLFLELPAGARPLTPTATG